jgi:hypothetical protein
MNTEEIFRWSEVRGNLRILRIEGRATLRAGCTSISHSAELVVEKRYGDDGQRSYSMHWEVRAAFSPRVNMNGAAKLEFSSGSLELTGMVTLKQPDGEVSRLSGSGPLCGLAEAGLSPPVG